MWSKLWVWRCSICTLAKLSRQVAISPEVKMIRRDNLVDQQRKEKPSILTHIATSLVNLVLQQEVVKSIELFLSLAWGWCASVVVMHTDVLIASGVADVLFAVMIIRMWCAGKIQMGRLIGS
jgi:hypothetical protein